MCKRLYINLKIVVSLVNFNTVKVNRSHYRPEIHGGFQEVKVPRLSDNGPGW